MIGWHQMHKHVIVHCPSSIVLIATMTLMLLHYCFFFLP